MAIVNPAAGGGRAAKLAGPQLARLREKGLRVDVIASTGPGHAAELASEAYGQGYRRFLAEDAHPVYSPEVLAHTAANEYEMEYEDRLGSISKPALIIAGEHDRTTTPRAARDPSGNGSPGRYLPDNTPRASGL